MKKPMASKVCDQVMILTPSLYIIGLVGID